MRRAREETRRGDPLPADGPPWVVLVAAQGSADGRAADHPDDIAAREETRAELRLLMSPRRLLLRGSSREPRAAARRCGTGRRPGRSRHRGSSRGLPRSDRRGLAAVHGAWCPAGGGGGRRARRWKPRTCSPNRHGSSERHACRVPAARQRPEPARRAPPGEGAARADPRRAGRGPTRAAGHARGRSSRRPASGGRRRDSASTATRSPTGCIGSRSVADWDLADPELRVALLLAVRVVQNAQESQPTPVLNRNRVPDSVASRGARPRPSSVPGCTSRHGGTRSQ